MDELAVLLIEDDDTDAMLLQHVVGYNGQFRLRVQRARSLAEGIELVQQSDPEVVLLDLGLPDSQGLHTFHLFHEAVPRCPVVVLTGTSDDQVAAAALEAGAQDYVVKDNLVGPLPVGRILLRAIERQQLQDRDAVHVAALARHGGHSAAETAGPDAIVLDAVRQMLHATRVEEIPGILQATIVKLGGTTTARGGNGADALVIDLSLDQGPSVTASAPRGSSAQAVLEAYLPQLVRDARRAVERLA